MVDNKNNLSELLILIAEHPELPVIPMVYSDVCEEDNNRYWLGDWGLASVDSYLSVDGDIYFYDDYDDLIEKWVDAYCDDEEYAELSEEKLWEMGERAIKKLPWKKAIIVYIETP